MKLANDCTLYVMRHGETDWNAARRLQGHTDIPLNDAGTAQAHALRDELAHVDFDAAYASDLQRAHDTAQIVMQPRAQPVKRMQALRECKMGPGEGMIVSHFEERFAALIHARNQLPLAERFQFKLHDEIESYHETFSRAEACLREIADAHAGGSVLVVSHGGVMRVLLLRMLASTGNVIVRNGGYFVCRANAASMRLSQMVGIDCVSM
jgi:broad specificity phosphatase PhoE